jgi:5-methyltetrahydrofolate--homocysteine methyltransferase
VAGILPTLMPNFGVAKINLAQLENYAKRKGVSLEQAEKLLSPNLE